MSGLSTTSSVASTVKVAYDGRVMTMEQSLDENFRDIQKLLNQLHFEMRQGAALTEQEVDEDDDFKEAVLFEDNVGDIITQMVRLLEELVPMCAEIRGKPPADCKEWYKQHKEVRKATLTSEKMLHKAAMERAKLELKAVLKGEPTEGKA